MATTRDKRTDEKMRGEPKNSRLEVRSTASQKSIIEEAAALMGESISSFILSTAIRDATAIINDHQITKLSLKDWNQFVSMLEDDVPPNSELKKARDLHKKHVVSSEGL